MINQSLRHKMTLSIKHISLVHGGEKFWLKNSTYTNMPWRPRSLLEFLVIFPIREVNFVPWWNEIKTISTADFLLLLTFTRNTPKDDILKFDALWIHIYKCMCLWNSQHASNGTLRDSTIKYFGYLLGLLKPIRIEYLKKNTQFSHKLLCKQYLYVWCNYCVGFTSSYKYHFFIHI